MIDYNQLSLELHAKSRGKIEISGKVKVETREQLSTAYTPGVAEPCRKIAENPELAYTYTIKSNTVAVVTDGTAVLGLGNIGPLAAMPVMEGKALLFKAFADIDAWPICLDTTDTEEIIRVVKAISPGFGGINLEDIAAPRCFEIEARLRRELDIPVFHDDQHGTAIVVLAGLINALKIVKKSLETAKIAINGAGSAGIAVAKLLLAAGAGDITLFDRFGALVLGNEHMNHAQAELSEITNPRGLSGSLADNIAGFDVFIGVSAPNVLRADDVAKMAKNAIVFALANPTPEIMPDDAFLGGAKIVATGRSDFPNQINNVLVFPGIFRGALDGRVKDIDDKIKLAAARAIAAIISDDELSCTNIIPGVFDTRVAPAVAKAVIEEAKSGR